MMSGINGINEQIAVRLTRAFGTMWICYAFMVYGLLPALALFHPFQDSFLYWSNWIELWSLPLILMGTNILGREAEARSKLDHERLARSYDEQQRTYSQIIAMLKRQEDMMTEMLKQDSVLAAQDVVLAEQTSLLKQELAYLERNIATLSGN